MSQLKRLKFYRCRVRSLPDNPFGKRPKFALNEFFVFKGLETGFFKNETSYLVSVVSVLLVLWAFPLLLQDVVFDLIPPTEKEQDTTDAICLQGCYWHSIVSGSLIVAKIVLGNLHRLY